MQLDYFYQYTEEDENCRIQCIRDMFLMYGKKIPYEFLLILSKSNLAYAQYLKYKAVSCPAFAASIDKCDCTILDNLHIKYNIEKHETDDEKWFCEKLKNGEPVIFYYSQNSIMSANRENKQTLGMVSSIIIYEMKNGICKSNIERLPEVSWEKLVKARNAQVIPYSPNSEVMFLENNYELEERLSDNNLKKCIYNAIENCTQNFLQGKKDIVEDNELYQGVSAIELMKEMYQTENERIQITKDKKNIKFYYLIIVNVLMKYMRIDYKHLVFEHITYIDAINSFAKWVNDDELRLWYNKNKDLFIIWNDIVNLLVYDAKKVNSKKAISKLLNRLGDLFEEAAQIEKEAFYELNQIVKAK